MRDELKGKFELCRSSCMTFRLMAKFQENIGSPAGDERVVDIVEEELMPEGWCETEDTSSMVLTIANMQKLMNAADSHWGDNWDMETLDG
jgi:hypothetical protein